MQRFNGAGIGSFLLEKEKYLFLAICVFTLPPIFVGQYFVTLDGPSHLYNAKVWSFLVFDFKPFLSGFYATNTLVPNTISHFGLSILLTFLPAFIAEKILVIGYVFLFAYSFRYLLKSFDESNMLLTYLIFPFIFSYPFLLGFYNFSFGIVLLFFSIGYWLRHNHTPFSWPFLFKISTLVFLTYTAHLVLLGLLLFMLSLETGVAFFHTPKGSRIKAIQNRIISALAASLAPLYFVYLYFKERPVSDSVFSSLDISTLLQYLFNLRPIIGFNHINEAPYSRTILIVFLALVIIYTIDRFRDKPLSPDQNKGKPEKSKQLFAGIAVISVLLLYFLLPDSDGRGSYVSIRMGLLIFPFLILFLSLQKFARTTVFVAIGIILIAHLVLVAQYTRVNIQVNPVIQEISGVSDLIDPNALVVVVNESEIWYMDHYSNYAGMEKPMVILDNYEADYGYFPVVWNESSFPNILVQGNKPNEMACLDFKSNIKGINKTADYLLVVGNSENLPRNCPDLYDFITSQKVKKLHYSAVCSLYKL